MERNCTSCRQNFEITPEDLEFYDRVSPVFQERKYQIPPPTLCPDCRRQRRLSFRDERKLYHRKCDLSGQQIISIYSPDKPYKVYESLLWWSEKWDPLEYGRSFDFSRPFFEQFQELSLEVPKLQYSAYNNENCPYMNRCSNCKDCYMCFNLDNGLDSYFSEIGFKLKDSIDCGFSKEMQLCAYCLDSKQCYGSTNLMKCSQLSESHFCFDCHNGQNLVLCWNLSGKSYCIANQQYSKEEYFQKKKELRLGEYSARQNLERMFHDFITNKAIHKFANILQSENCSGDNIFSSKNCRDCYDVLEGEDLVRVTSVDDKARDSMDADSVWDGAELIYESMSANRYSILFSYNVWESSHVLYSELCKNTKNIFGCSGLKNGEYIILNKQYSKKEYESMIPKIIEHMVKMEEWGRFFPAALSPFGYNETVAFEYFPLSREEALQGEMKWHADDNGEKYMGPFFTPPETINEVDESVCSRILRCEVSGNPYKIIPQELELYRKLKIPLPRKCPEQRHSGRFRMRNPRKLWERSCSKCVTEIKTSYAPDRKEQVYCENCYLTTLY